MDQLSREISSEFVWTFVFIFAAQAVGVLTLLFMVRDRIAAWVASIAVVQISSHNDNLEAHGHLTMKMRSELRYEVQDKIDKHHQDPYAHPTAFERIKTELEKIDRRWDERFEGLRKDLLAAVKERD